MWTRLDLTGQRFGRLEAIKPSHKDSYGKWHWLCKCDCGNEVTISRAHLRDGNTKSCGCLHKELSAIRQTLNLENQRFGRLVVKQHVGQSKSGNYLWLCDCDCGNECIVYSHSLISNSTKSCGCLRKDQLKTHGQAYTRLYIIHKNIKQRCYNINHPAYSYYGEKGIQLCEEWHDFMTFKEWAESNGYAKELTIDRIDGNKGYNPSNCRWISSPEQASNIKSNILITYKGETKILARWAEDTGIKAATLAYRIRSDNWSVEQALTTPVRRHKK